MFKSLFANLLWVFVITFCVPIPGQVFAQHLEGCDESCDVAQLSGPGFGPGTEMTKIINRLGLGADCGRCKALAAEMDRGGVAWVKENFEYVVAKTISNAERLGHKMGPVKKHGVRTIVRHAMAKSKLKNVLNRDRASKILSFQN